MVKLAIFVVLALAATCLAQIDGRYRPVPNRGFIPAPIRQIATVINAGRYDAASDGRYRPSNEGRYNPDGSGAYNGDNGRYNPDGLGGYTGQSDKYQHVKDKFGGGGSGAGGAGGAGGFGSGGIRRPTVAVGSGINAAAGFGAPVAIKQGSASGKYDNRNYAIIRQDGHVDEDGYHYLYETENGITGEEQGKLANRGTDQEAMKANGFYTYTGPDSVVYTVTYTADENGFLPQGDHIPTPPPIPEAIVRSLEYQRAQGTL